MKPTGFLFLDASLYSLFPSGEEPARRLTGPELPFLRTCACILLDATIGLLALHGGRVEVLSIQDVFVWGPLQPWTLNP